MNGQVGFFFINLEILKFDVNFDDDCDTRILVTEKLIRAFDRNRFWLSEFIW